MLYLPLLTNQSISSQCMHIVCKKFSSQCVVHKEKFYLTAQLTKIVD